jgi:ferrous iron transport protein B
MSTVRVALAGQPNSGKSTLFNALTGARQFVANYPGVTVDKMYGWYRHKGVKVEVVDLPGTYSLTSYSPEERVSRDVLLYDKPSVVVNVLDASNIRRSLYLTLQLIEMESPLILNINMMDVAESHGVKIDTKGLSDHLQVPVVTSIMSSGKGKEELREAIAKASNDGKSSVSKVDLNLYPEATSEIDSIMGSLAAEASLEGTFPMGWLAIKLLEGDSEVEGLIRNKASNSEKILTQAAGLRATLEEKVGMSPDLYVASCRSRKAAQLASKFVQLTGERKTTLSERIDKVVCNKILGPIFLMAVIYVFYYLSFVQGYNMTHYTWPILAWIRSTISGLLPQAGIIDVPMTREFVLWMVDNINALLNYIPIFFILFSLIAILEDSGYMPRIAFVLDRILRRFGLHGQSTLPMILSGIVLGGCAVPGVMATKGIPDERSRLATILTLPMLNCQAKLPLYFLLIGIYFNQTVRLPFFGTVNQQTVVIVFIQTISILFVLPIAKFLSSTVLKNKQTAPFIMEMPAYHLPTIRGVLVRAFERIWLYIKKITTVVAAVALVVFVLLQFPGISQERYRYYVAEKEKVVANFLASVQSSELAKDVKTEDDLLKLMEFQLGYKELLKSGASLEKKKAYGATNPDFYEIVSNKRNPEARKIDSALKGVIRFRQDTLKQMKEERIENSILGRIGRGLEPLSKYAGFTWRVNVAVLSTLAAKENAVSTLGALYQNDEEDSDEALESRMKKEEKDFTPLHAMALMLFMVLCPPCLPTIMAVRIQTGSNFWMLFSFFFQLTLGLITATLVFSVGSMLGLSGFQAMWAFYLIPLTLTVISCFIKPKQRPGA